MKLRKMKTKISRIISKIKKNYLCKWISPKSLKLRWSEYRKQFKYSLAIVCIAKNEGAYIKEWIEYHLLQGIEQFYIYDNESPDDMKHVLAPYIKSGIVTYHLIEGKGKQLDAYNDAINRYKNEVKYLCFIDVDEFLVQEKAEKSIVEIINIIMKKNYRSGGIAVNWRMYGSSGYAKKQKGSVLETFLYRGSNEAKGNECIKTIANPRYIKKYEHVHFPTYVTGFNNIDENGKIVLGWYNKITQTKVIRINHYFTKSEEEWIERRKNGKADTEDDNDKRTMQEFYLHDNNDVFDPIMMKYVEKLRPKLEGQEKWR